jgi:hypothetical protein
MMIDAEQPAHSQDAARLEALIKYTEQMYARVNQKWEKHEAELFNGECGFSILGSPPSLQPTLMIIGENPGFGASDVGRGPRIESSWPPDSYLDGPTWSFKDRLAQLFEGAGREEVLRSAVVTNFLFFKSGSLTREGAWRWSSLPSSLCRELEAFCQQELRGFIDLSAPQNIMIFGMGAFRRRATEQAGVLRAADGKRWLIRTGKIAGTDALGVMHPTGAWWAADDWPRASEWLRSYFEHQGAG